MMNAKKGCFPFLFAILVISAIACAPLEQQRRSFIDKRNSEIGRKFSSVSLPEPVEKKTLDTGYTYYLFRSGNKGCRWSCEVNPESGVIEFWQFESDPNLCYR